MFKSTAYGIDTTAPVWAIDLALDDPTTTTSGCEATDFDGVPPGAIVVVQRGNCAIINKFLNAEAAGAAAVAFISAAPGDDGAVFFNFDGIDIPTAGITLEAATTLVGGVANGDTGREARFRIDWRPGTYTTRNVIAETPTGDPDNVIAVGAHLDSVGVGPGINDNGSGSASILEIAEQMQKVKPRNKVRFLWFAAEESGLLGSEAYVDSLSEEKLDRIAAMLNFDMVGSPNFVRFVYDGDLSDSVPPPSAHRRGRRRSRRSSSTGSTPRAWPPSRPSSVAGPTTARSSRRGSRPAACSPAPRKSRPTSRRRSTAEPRGSSTTRATTSAATTSTTSAWRPSTR